MKHTEPVRAGRRGETAFRAQSARSAAPVGLFYFITEALCILYLRNLGSPSGVLDGLTPYGPSLHILL